MWETVPPNEELGKQSRSERSNFEVRGLDSFFKSEKHHSAILDKSLKKIFF